jgi:subtilisin family serine protease
MTRLARPSLAVPVLALTALVGCYEIEAGDPPPDRVDGEFVIGITEDGSEAAVRDLADDLGMTLIAYRGLDRTALLATSQETDETLLDLEASDAVAFAEPHFLYHVERTPDDYAEYLWGLENTGLNRGTEDADIDAFAAWDITTGEGIVVAIIDTGVDASHPDLAPNMWVNPGEIAGNGRDDDGNGYVDDVNGWDFMGDDGEPDDLDGHGTHVAGTVAARGDDGYGVVGTAFGARIMGLKFLEGRRGGSTYDAAAAIHYAVNQGADVINASWAGPGYSTMLRNAINYARSRGVVFVAAAGNEGNDNDRVSSYPANYDLGNVVSVAASDRNDRLASFSNYGDQSVDVAAPGDEIVSTVPGANWSYMNGTSMAAPMVAGVAALLKSAQAGLSGDDVRDALMASVDPIVGGSSRLASGGRINAFSALAQVGAVPAPGNEQQEPEEEPAPAAWTFVSFPIESPHPYGNDFSGWVGVDAPEQATELRLHFSRITVESGYDFVTVKDLAGTQLAQWTGDVGAVVSEPVPARQVTVHLYTDGSVTDWGLALEGFSWR